LKHSALFLGLLLAAVWLMGCTRIGPGHVGIQVNMAGSQRGVQDFELSTGWVYYMPGKTAIFEYPTYVQSYVWTHDEKEGSEKNEEITFTTKDALLVALDVNVSYSLVPEKIPAFYVKFRSDDIKQFTHGFLRSVARDCFNEVGGRYGVEQIMGDNSAFLKDARDCTQAHVAPYGVNLDQFGIIGAPRPPRGVIEAINAKVQATQIALQKQNEVLQAKADAEKAVAQANGAAQATIAQANGDAQATLIRAKTQAEANSILSKSLTPELIEYRKLDKWDGVLPTVSGAANAWVSLPAKSAQ